MPEFEFGTLALLTWEKKQHIYYAPAPYCTKAVPQTQLAHRMLLFLPAIILAIIDAVPYSVLMKMMLGRLGSG